MNVSPLKEVEKYVKNQIGLVIVTAMMLITMLLVIGMVEIVVTMKIQVGTNGVQPANALSLRLYRRK